MTKRLEDMTAADVIEAWGDEHPARVAAMRLALPGSGLARVLALQEQLDTPEKLAAYMDSRIEAAR